jgi:hypothetical protein
MTVLVFALIVLVVAGIVCAIAYKVPFPASVSWLRWAIPCLALVIALVLILQRLGAV